jgi:hypothetical protein
LVVNADECHAGELDSTATPSRLSRMQESLSVAMLASRSAGNDGEGDGMPPWQWVVRAPPAYGTSYGYRKSSVEGSWKEVKGYRDQGGVRKPIEFKTFELRNGVVTGTGQDPGGKFTLAGTYRYAFGDRPGDPDVGDSVLFYQHYLGQSSIRYTGLIGRLDKAKEEDEDKYFIGGNWIIGWNMGADTGDFYLALDK